MKKLLPFVTSWMDLEKIILSEISQSMKDKYYMILLKSEKQIFLISFVSFTYRGVCVCVCVCVYGLENMFLIFPKHEQTCPCPSWYQALKNSRFFLCF